MISIKELHEADKRLMEEFGITDSSRLLIPLEGEQCFAIKLDKLTEEQARAVLKAAVESGVDIKS